MAYEQKPGQGSLFKNDKAAENEKAPIYKGSCTTPDGKKWEMAAWVRETQSGVKYFSIALKEPYQQQEANPMPSTQSHPAPVQSAPVAAAPAPAAKFNDLPF